MKNLTITRKLMISISLCIILLIGGATVIQYKLFSNLIIERVIHNELPSSLESIRNDIEANLSRPITTAKSLANNIFLHDWLLAGEPQENSGSAVENLKRIQQTTGADSVFYVSALSGKYYTAEGMQRILNREEDSWFYQFIDDLDSPDYTVELDSEGGELKVFINYLIESNNERMGIAGVSYTLNGMSEMIRGYHLGNTGSVFLTSQDGTINIHPDGAAMAGQPVTRLFVQVSSLFALT